ncbi:MAG: phospholipid carrier-dependent glycosyltransferase [Anaerolineales bacterium]
MPRPLFFALLVLALVGVWLVWFATPYGMGLTDDSIAYIGAARTLLKGEGYRAAWLASQRFLTHFPPGYPLALATIDLLTGLEPYRAARLLNGLLFGLNTLLMGWLGWRMTRRPLWALAPAMLFLFSAGLLRVHIYALSEPLYIFLTLAAFHAWLWDEDRPRNGLWSYRGEILAGLFSGLAYVTRYAALALIATFLALPFFLPFSWRERLKRIVIYLLAVLPLPLAWSIRNMVVVGNLTNRLMVWHPVTPEQLRQGIHTFSSFLVPLESWRAALRQAWPPLFTLLVILLFLTLIAWLLYWAWKSLWLRTTTPPQRAHLLQALYAVAYPASMLASISLFDASTPLNWRILSPLFPPLLALAVAALASLGKRSHIPATLLLLALLSLHLAGGIETLHTLRMDGQGFASWRWYDAVILKEIPKLPPEVRIYTNQGPAVYFYTGRTTYALPAAIAATTRLPNAGVEQAIETIRQEVLQGKAVVALFDRDNPAPEHLLVVQGLPVLYKTGQDALFGLKELLP